MPKPIEEVAVIIDAKIDQFTSGDWQDWRRPSGKLASEEIAEAVLSYLTSHGFLTLDAIVAIQAEKDAK